MLNENIKTIRKSKGLSQEELANKLNVVRQTVSKWELGLSVPDSIMLISLSEILETPVSTLLGEKVKEEEVDDLKVISNKLETINLQLAKSNEFKRKIIHIIFLVISILIVVGFIVLLYLGSPYLKWSSNDMETAIVKVGVHGFEWIYVRVAPIILIFTIIITFVTRKH